MWCLFDNVTCVSSLEVVGVYQIMHCGLCHIYIWVMNTHGISFGLNIHGPY